MLISSTIVLALIFGVVIGTLNFGNNKEIKRETEKSIIKATDNNLTERDIIIHETEPQKDSSENPDEPPLEPAVNYNVGDIIQMGSYEQDNIIGNGSEPIEWTVLDIVDNKALVICNYGIDCLPFNSYDGNVLWEDCSLRYWLNNDFYNSSFTNIEKMDIVNSDLYNSDNPIYGTDGGSITRDKIFVPSIEEYNRYSSSTLEIKCTGTKYAEINGAYIDRENNRECNWVLRTPGSDSSRISSVYSYGPICYEGDPLTFKYFAVRPAMWIYIY